jgi:hypothetical protein
MIVQNQPVTAPADGDIISSSDYTSYLAKTPYAILSRSSASSETLMVFDKNAIFQSYPAQEAC